MTLPIQRTMASEEKCAPCAEEKYAPCASCLKVSNNLLRCSKCGEVSYCNRDCQRRHWKGQNAPRSNAYPTGEAVVVPPHKQWCIADKDVDSTAQRLANQIAAGTCQTLEPIDDETREIRRNAIEHPALRCSTRVYDAAVEKYGLHESIRLGLWEELLDLQSLMQARDAPRLAARMAEAGFAHCVFNYLLTGSAVLDDRAPGGRFFFPGLRGFGSSCGDDGRILHLIRSHEGVWRAWITVLSANVAAHTWGVSDILPDRSHLRCRDMLIGTIFALTQTEVAEMVLSDQAGDIDGTVWNFKEMNEALMHSGEDGPIMNWTLTAENVLRVQATRLKSEEWANDATGLDKFDLADGTGPNAHLITFYENPVVQGGAFALVHKRAAITGADLEPWAERIKEGLSIKELCDILDGEIDS
uniref:MYND-type domain-containing protein n=1 Tax=Trieres chinensis TaxID=1514140 RepID=A0A7S2E9E5_TRICV|mmetsp:Transcript_13160/g.27193  ORF Transcript_13160/g.27193 Transcript_13160/m.27193 type:complete len:414 (+) Transcript_13160:3-1244(+)